MPPLVVFLAVSALDAVVTVATVLACAVTILFSLAYLGGRTVRRESAQDDGVWQDNVRRGMVRARAGARAGVVSAILVILLATLNIWLKIARP